MSRGVLGLVGRASTGRPRSMLVAVLLLVALAAVFGGELDSRLSAGGFFDDSSESRRADTALEEVFGAGPVNTAIVFDPVEGFVSQKLPELAALHRALEADPLIESVMSPVDPETDRQVDWPTGLHPLIGAGGRSALVVFTVVGDEDEVLERLELVEARYAGVVSGVEHRLTGPAPVARETREIAEDDLSRAELLSTPVTLVALLLVFGGLVAAVLPLVVALVAIVGTFAALTVVTGFSDVSVFARTLTTALGLGLGIDYSLFVVSRFREERRAGHDVDAAVDRTLRTAGRTVLFSAATVMVSLTALLLFPIVYLRSFAYAGIAVVALAAAAAVVALPPALVLLGDRVDKLTIRRRPAGEGPGFWQRQARRVIGRPWPYALVVTAVLVVAGLPFMGVNLSRVDDRILPESASTRSAAQTVGDDYGSALSTTDIVVLDFGAPVRIRAVVQMSRSCRVRSSTATRGSSSPSTVSTRSRPSGASTPSTPTRSESPTSSSCPASPIRSSPTMRPGWSSA
jgi:RND superfamily putative drug exporter